MKYYSGLKDQLSNDIFNNYKANVNRTHDIMHNSAVPITNIITSIIGFILCLSLLNLLKKEYEKLLYRQFTRSAWKLLIGFVLMTLIYQIVLFGSSIIFLAFKTKSATDEEHNLPARIFGMLHLWVRISLSCISLLMLLYSFTTNIKFKLWNVTILYFIIAPLFMSFYPFIQNLTGFNFTSLFINTCGVSIFLHTKEIFQYGMLWNFAIVLVDFSISIFCVILIIYVNAKDKTSFRVVPHENEPLIKNLTGLMIMIPVVTMTSKALDFIRCGIYLAFFIKLAEATAHGFAIISLVLMIIGSIYEISQPALTILVLKVFITGEAHWLYALRKDNNKFLF